MHRQIALLMFCFLQLFLNIASADGTTSPKAGIAWHYGTSGWVSPSAYQNYQAACNAYATNFDGSSFTPRTCSVRTKGTVSACNVFPAGNPTTGSIVIDQHISPSGCDSDAPETIQYNGVLYSDIGNHCPDGASPLPSGECLCPPRTTLDINEFACKSVTETTRSQEPMPDCHKCVFGQPINPLTGTMTHSINLNLGLAQIQQVLTFDTTRRLPVVPAPAPNQEYSDLEPAGVPLFGELWSGSLQKQILLDQFSARVIHGDGTATTFLLDSQGNATPVSAGLPDRLVASSTGFQYSNLTENSEEFYTITGLLTQISFADGRVLSYSYSDSSTPTSIAPGPGYLIQIMDNYSRTIKFVYTGSFITQINDSAGASVGLNYDSFQNLSKISWTDGTFLQLVYGRSDLPWAMTSLVDENASTTVSWEYDAAGRATATQSGGGAARYSVDYGASAPALAVQDVWDDAAKVFRRTRGIQLDAAPVVTLPNGSQTTVFPTVNSNMPRLGGVSHPAGAGTAASVRYQSYDPSKANRLSVQDFNGNTTCYAYENARNLVTVTMEGLPSNKTCPSVLSTYVPSPVDAAHPERKTTTVWHPDWALKTQEAEPKKITTWVYNGQPDPIAGTTAACVTPATTLPDGKPLAVLCARYEQATTDATGALGTSASVTGPARAWMYTYNQNGQLLTQTTPKQSATDALSRTTTYTYFADTSISSNVGHTIGDLQSVKNPVGQVTYYTSYDGDGRLLSSTDPNGTITQQTYWPRGWLQTQTVTAAGGTALTTSYAYWPTGLLKTVTMPDASALNYVYDDAHRLTDVTDSAGNKIHYVLDSVGNRTSEQVSDAAGHLASTVSRVFDALNRVQSQTGVVH